MAEAAVARGQAQWLEPRLEIVRELTEANGDGDDLLILAYRTVQERETTYGSPPQHWGKAARMANALFDTDLFTAEMWGTLWILDKLVREQHRPQRDNRLDIAGYIAGVDRINRMNID